MFLCVGYNPHKVDILTHLEYIDKSHDGQKLFVSDFYCERQCEKCSVTKN